MCVIYILEGVRVCMRVFVCRKVSECVWRRQRDRGWGEGYA